MRAPAVQVVGLCDERQPEFPLKGTTGLTKPVRLSGIDRLGALQIPIKQPQAPSIVLCEEVLIQALKLHCSARSNPNIVLDHEICQSFAIDQDHPLR